MATFLLSWLSRQYAALDASVFLREQPGDWLVMESDPNSPARAAEPIAARLAPRRDRPHFSVGRDPGSDLVVSEPGVELSHAILERDEGGRWTLRRASPDAVVELDGLPLGDFAVPLGSGARIGIGGARLTYYDGTDLQARLRVAA